MGCRQGKISICKTIVQVTIRLERKLLMMEYREWRESKTKSEETSP